MFKRYLDSVCVRYPGVMARLMGEWPLRPIRYLYEGEPKELAESLCNKAIPCNVYQVWTHSVLGKSHSERLAEFIHLNPEYRFWLYDADQMDAYMQEHYADHPVYSVYINAQYGPVKTDIWRYCILFERGGFYFDINKMVEVPLSTIVQPADTAVVSYEKNLLPAGFVKGPECLAHPDRLVLNWGFGFAKGHPILAAILENIVADYPAYKGVRFPNVKEAILNLTGPHQLTKTIHQMTLKRPPMIREAGVDFYGHGNPNIHRSWVRYAAQPSYAREASGVIVK